MIFVPYFMGKRSRDGARLAGGEALTLDLPAITPLERMAVLYTELAGRVAAVQCVSASFTQSLNRKK